MPARAFDFGDIGIVFIQDSAFHISHPMLGRFPDEVRKQAVNAMLRSHHAAAVAQYRDCRNGIISEQRQESETPEPEFAYEVLYASPTLLSIAESGSVYCGGAHPSNYVTPKTFDLVTQRQIGGMNQNDLSPEGFGSFLKLQTKEERLAFERFAFGRWMDTARQFPESSDCLEGFKTGAEEGERFFRPGGEEGWACNMAHGLCACGFNVP